jgi:hypothetical protein
VRPADRAAWRRTVLPLAIFAVVFAVAAHAIGPWPTGVFWDDGIYVALARSIVAGHGLHVESLPGAPAAIHYPPGYPAFLALLWRVGPAFPANLALFKLANAALLAAGAAGAWIVARRQALVPPTAAALAVVAAAVSIPSLTVSVVLFSEPLFLALLAPTVALAEYAADREDGALLPSVGAGAMAGALALVRTVGIAMIPGLAVAVLVRRKPRAARRAAIGVATALAVMAPWQLFVGRHARDLPPALRGNYGTYGAWLTPALHAQGFAFFPRVARENVLGLVRIGRTLFSPAGALWIAVPFALFAIAIAAVGVARLWSRAPALIAGGAAYLMIVLLWPYYIDRFLWAVWPYVALVLAAGVARVWSGLRGRSDGPSVLGDAPPVTESDGSPRHPGIAAAAGVVGRWSVLGACCIAGFAYARYNVRGFAHRWWEGAEQQQAELARPVVAWVLAHSAPGDVIACEGEPLVHLYTGRRTVPTGSSTALEYLAPQPVADAVASLRAVIADYRPAYVIVSSGGGGAGPAAEYLLREQPPELALVDTLPAGGAVFRPLVTSR